MIHPEWSYSAVLYEMNIRQLTPEGTINSASSKLEALRSLGIDILWLMPIYPIGKEDRKGTLGSYYSIADYCDINPEFGTMADFDAFLSKAHELGFRVILDWVANHTARDAKWVSEKPADWYERDENGSPLVPWDWSDTAKLNYENHDVWQGQIEAMKFWIKRGVDGFRCDMAMLVPIEFWQEASSSLHAMRSDIFMLAEAEETNLFDRAFDACYSWELHHKMCDVAQSRARANVIRDQLYAMQNRFPRWAMNMSFTSNHDENSWQGKESDRLGQAQEIMRVFTFVSPSSMPLIYTGQEVDYDHSFNFFDHDPIPNYEFGEGAALYTKLAEIKHRFNCLKAGDGGSRWCTINNNAEDCLLILVRESKVDCVIAIMNLSPYNIYISYNSGIYAGEYKNLMSGEWETLPTEVYEQMEPWSYKLLGCKR